jgi:mannose-6-phosphate isomerase-like protein (cupin superfamily)
MRSSAPTVSAGFSRAEVNAMDVVLVPAGGGEVLPDPVRIRVLEDGSNTGHQVGVVELVCPPGSGGPPQHIHRKHSETFYVVSGTMRFTSAGEHVDVSAGGLVTAPIGVPHTFSNPDPDEWATCIGTVAPDLYIGYFRELAALAAQRGGAYEISEMDQNAVRELMARYATEPYRPPGS